MPEDRQENKENPFNDVEQMRDENLVYVGRVINLEPIENADFIVLATVVCGAGGKWRGIVKKDCFEVGSKCLVYLPDAIIPESPEMQFMESSNWRVRMRRFRGAPSECVIMPSDRIADGLGIGTDCTQALGVKKYYKPVPAHLNGLAIGFFPSFIPKTDEPNWQRAEDLIDMLTGLPYYVTEKCDGSSTTAYRYKDTFGLCSRNLELKEDPENGYWKIALKYDLPNLLPEGVALQWETCGPGVQSNPHGLKDLAGFAFSGYKIHEHRYLTFVELYDLCVRLKFPMARLISTGAQFDPRIVPEIGEITYKNGRPGEGVVVRSCDNLPGGMPISFKVINLGYER